MPRPSSASPLLPLLLLSPPPPPSPPQNQLLVRTPADRQKAMNPCGFPYFTALPQTELYFLLPFVYCVIAPLYLPFALVYFIAAYIVYRNQVRRGEGGEGGERGRACAR